MIDMKVQPKKREEVDGWGPINFNASKVGLKAQLPAASSTFLQKVEQRQEDDWDDESDAQSSRLQTLDEAEKIKNMNAWIAKQPPIHQRSNPIPIDFLLTHHFNSSMSNFAPADTVNIGNFNKKNYQTKNCT